MENTELSYELTNDQDVIDAAMHEANILEHALTTRNDLHPIERENLILALEVLREDVPQNK